MRFVLRLLFAAAGLAVSALSARPAAAESVKLVKPEQYRSRVVAAKKGRVVLVNFWATWCEPCREEMPALAAAAKGFPSKDVAVTLVSTDSIKKTADVQRFLAAAKIPFVCWQAKSADPQRFIEAVDKSWNGAVPYTLVYDRKGELSARLLGPQTERSFAEAVRKALAAGP
ncbi:MAG TPA: TlpA family protein disulfide reductase [Thermoanaerobaculia bacterium]